MATRLSHGTRAGNVISSSRLGSDNSVQARTNRAYVEIPGTTPTRQGMHQAPQRSSGLTSSSSTAIVTSTSNNASTSNPATHPVLTLLLSSGIPHADAERIVQLLTSLGIQDAAYLRVLACMSTRDEWLRELCEKGDLTEIQMRVVREMLEHVARRVVDE